MSEIDWIEFITIAGAHLLAVSSPGPDFAITVKQSVANGKKAGIYTALGIGSGIFAHILFAVFGFALIISQNEYAYLAMRIIGGAYLIYIGVMSLRAKSFQLKQLLSQQAPISNMKAFKQGLFVNLLNVKATLFFLSLYSAIINSATSLGNQVFYGVYMAIATGIWFSIMALFFGNLKVREKFLKYGVWFERIFGILMIALGVHLML